MGFSPGLCRTITDLNQSRIVCAIVWLSAFNSVCIVDVFCDCTFTFCVLLYTTVQLLCVYFICSNFYKLCYKVWEYCMCMPARLHTSMHIQQCMKMLLHAALHTCICRNTDSLLVWIPKQRKQSWYLFLFCSLGQPISWHITESPECYAKVKLLNIKGDEKSAVYVSHDQEF